MKSKLAERVAEAFDTEDGRTIPEMIAADTFDEVTVEKVELAGTSRASRNHWITWNGGVTASFEVPPGKRVKVGDKIRIYPNAHFGGRRHGWALNGELVEWKTPQERIVDDVAWLAKNDRERREKFETNRGELLRQKEALPEPLRKRIERFERESPTFWVDSGWYELFCCTEAAKFAERAREAVKDGKHADDVDRFWRMPIGDGEGKREDYAIYREEPEMPEVRWLIWAWALNGKTYGYDPKRQKQILGLDEGHSGNTFGGAMHLAVALVQELVEVPADV